MASGQVTLLDVLRSEHALFNAQHAHLPPAELETQWQQHMSELNRKVIRPNRQVQPVSSIPTKRSSSTAAAFGESDPKRPLQVRFGPAPFLIWN